MKAQERIQVGLAYMQELYGDYPQTELQYRTPFQLLVAVVLSAQTTDKQVNKVTEKLFQRVQTPQELLDLGPVQFGEMIKTVGLWTSKAKNLYRLAEILVEQTKQETDKEPREIAASSLRSSSQGRLPAKKSKDILAGRGYRLPDSLEEFLKLPGVGIKTAKVVMPILYGKGYVAVDTHVQRVATRLGRVTTSSPDQTSRQLEELIPEEQKSLAHRVIIYFGRYRCTARNPQCDACKLKDICLRYATAKKIESRK